MECNDVVAQHSERHVQVIEPGVHQSQCHDGPIDEMLQFIMGPPAGPKTCAR